MKPKLSEYDISIIILELIKQRSKMRRFLPVFLFIFVFTLFLGGQVAFKSIANLVSDNGEERLLLTDKEQAFSNNIIELSGDRNIKRIPIIVLQFWAPWCSICLTEFPGLVKLQKTFDRSNLVVLSIRSNSENGDFLVRKIQKKYNLNFPVITDVTGKYFDRFKIKSVPTTVVYFNGRLLEYTDYAKNYSSDEQVDRFKNLINQSK